MNREIKFRALCEYETELNTHNSMVYFGLPEMDNGLWAFPIDKSIRHINSYESPLMQFTGLLDRNKREVYVGDVIKQGASIYEIKMGIGGMYCKEISTERDEYLFRQLESDKCEVIGNLVDNPELLKP